MWLAEIGAGRDGGRAEPLRDVKTLRYHIEAMLRSLMGEKETGYE